MKMSQISDEVLDFWISLYIFTQSTNKVNWKHKQNEDIHEWILMGLSVKSITAKEISKTVKVQCSGLDLNHRSTDRPTSSV